MANNDNVKTFTVNLNIADDKYKKQLQNIAKETGAAMKQVSDTEVELRFSEHVKNFDRVLDAVKRFSTEASKYADIRFAIDTEGLKKDADKAAKEIDKLVKAKLMKTRGDASNTGIFSLDAGGTSATGTVKNAEQTVKKYAAAVGLATNANKELTKSEQDKITKILEAQKVATGKGGKYSDTTLKEAQKEIDYLNIREEALKRIAALEETTNNGKKLFELDSDSVIEYTNLLKLVSTIESRMASGKRVEGTGSPLLSQFKEFTATDFTTKIKEANDAITNLSTEYRGLITQFKESGGASIGIFDSDMALKFVNELDKQRNSLEQVFNAMMGIVQAEKEVGEAGEQGMGDTAEAAEHAGQKIDEAAEKARKANAEFEKLKEGGVLTRIAETQPHYGNGIDSKQKSVQDLVANVSGSVQALKESKSLDLKDVETTYTHIKDLLDMMDKSLESIKNSEARATDQAKTYAEYVTATKKNLEGYAAELDKIKTQLGGTSKGEGNGVGNGTGSGSGEGGKGEGQGKGKHAGPLYTQADVEESRVNLSNTYKDISDIVQKIKSEIFADKLTLNFDSKILTDITEAYTKLSVFKEGLLRKVEQEAQTKQHEGQIQQQASQQDVQANEVLSNARTALQNIEEAITRINGSNVIIDTADTVDRLEKIYTVLQGIETIVPEINTSPLILLNADEEGAIERIKAAVSTINEATNGRNALASIFSGTTVDGTVSKQLTLYREILDINKKIANLDELSIGYNNELNTLEENRAKAQKELLEWRVKEQEQLTKITSAKDPQDAAIIERLANEKRLAAFQEVRAKKEREIAETNAKVQTRLMNTAAKETEKEVAAEEKAAKANQKAQEQQAKAQEKAAAEREKQLQYEQKVARELAAQQQKQRDAMKANTEKSQATAEEKRVKDQNAALDKQVSIYKEILDLDNQIAKLDMTQAGSDIRKDAIEADRPRLQQEFLKAKQEERSIINSISDAQKRADAEQEAAQKRLIALQEARLEKERELNKINANNQANIVKAVDTYTNSKSYQNTGNLIAREQANPQNYRTEDITNLSNAYDKLKASIENVRKAQNPAEAQKYYAEYKTAKKNVEDLANSMQKLVKTSNGATTKPMFKFVGNAESLEDAKKYLAEANAELKNIVPSTSDAGKGITTLSYKLDEQDGIVKTLKFQFNKATGAITEFGSTEKAVTSIGERFTSMLKQRGASLVAYLATYASFYRLVGVLRDGINVVHEVDTAFTELRKVAQESDDQLKSFANTMAFDIAGEIGNTGKNIINLTADFERLGYALSDAQNLAKDTAVLMNVGDMENSEDAMQSLVSTMKGFNLTAEDSSKIVDEFNEIGNRFSISTEGISQAMQRSSAALAQANNSLEQSLALAVAANDAIQDPQQVGNTLKVVALRIRGKIFVPIYGENYSPCYA